MRRPGSCRRQNANACAQSISLFWQAVAQPEVVPATGHIIKLLRQAAQRRALDKHPNGKIGRALRVSSIFIIDAKLLADAGRPGERSVTVQPQEDFSRYLPGPFR